MDWEFYGLGLCVDWSSVGGHEIPVNQKKPSFAGYLWKNSAQRGTLTNEPSDVAMFGREIEGKESFVQITTYLLNSAFLNDDVFSIAFKCLLQRHPWLPGVFCSYEVQGI